MSVQVLVNQGVIPVAHAKDSIDAVKPKATHLLFVITTLIEHTTELLKDSDQKTDIVHNYIFLLIDKVKKVKEEFLRLLDNPSNASALRNDQVLPIQGAPGRVSGYSPQATQASSVTPSTVRSNIPTDFSDLDVLDCALFVLCDTVRTLQEYIEKDRRENIQVKKGLGTFFQGKILPLFRLLYFIMGIHFEAF